MINFLVYASCVIMANVVIITLSSLTDRVSNMFEIVAFIVKIAFVSFLTICAVRGLGLIQ